MHLDIVSAPRPAVYFYDMASTLIKLVGNSTKERPSPDLKDVPIASERVITVQKSASSGLEQDKVQSGWRNIL